MKKYDCCGKLVNTYSFGADITYTFCGFSSGIYAICRGGLYRISDEGFTKLSDSGINAPLFDAGAGYLISRYGDVYSVSDGVKRVFRADHSGEIKSACVIGETLYCPGGSVINGYDVHTGEKICYYPAGVTQPDIYAEGDKIIYTDNNGGSVMIGTGAFTEIRRDSKNGGEDPDNGQEAEIGTISSDIYTVSNDSLKISGIPSGTTFAVFKKNMNFAGYAIKLYRNGSEKKSGNVGTAMNAVFTSDKYTFTYELSVIGDLTGEGSVNSKDLNTLMDYLIGSVDFDGVYLTSADLSNDGKADVIDSAMMKRLIG